MGKKSTPPPPDYTAAAEKTAASNQEAMTQQTWANRPSQVDPWGRIDWQASSTIDPSTGKPVTQWTQNTTLDPRLQQALDSQINVQQQRSDMAQGLMGRAQGEFSQPMDWGSLSPWGATPQGGNLQTYTSPFGFGGPQASYINPTTGAGYGGPQGGNLQAYTSAYGGGPQQQAIDTSRMATPQLQMGLDFGGTQNVQGADVSRQRAEDAIYKSATSRLDPQWQQRQTDLETQLANRGITTGSEAYTRAMDDFNRQRSDAYQQASMGAITGAGAEAQRNQGMDLSAHQQQVGDITAQGQFANTAAGQAFGFGGQAAQQQLAAQQAAFGQSLQAGQYGLGQQQQAFGQQQAATAQNYAQAMQAYQQQMAQQQQAYQQQLGSSGQYYQQGADAYQRMLAQQQQAFAQQQQAGAQNFQQQYQSSQLANQLRQAQLQEAMTRRGFSLNEIQALLNGQQVSMPNFQGFQGAGNAGGVDYSGAAQNQWGAAIDANNAQQAGWANTLNAITGIGMAGIMRK